MPPKETEYPTPLSFPPSSGEHTHTFILLHGRGSNAERFGPEFLESSNIASYLPTVKFVFPTASKRRATALKRIPIRQWFDNYSLEDPDSRTELQIEGLCQTGEFLRSLIEHEAELLGEGGFQKIILGGLSQGCAASLFALLAGGFGDDGKQGLAAFVGMSGWLPFRAQMVALMRAPTSKKNDDEENDRVDDFDPFDRSVGAGEGKSSKTDAKSPEALALNLVRDILDLPALSLPDTLPENEFPSEPTADHLHLPVFLGHGAEDPKVSVRLGEKMVSFLSWDLLIDVTWKVYEDFGHWYKVPDEINDIVRFLKRKTSVPVMEPFGPNTAPVGW